MLLGAGATPEAPQHGDPIWEYALGRVLDREVGEGAATNLGLLLGLPGAWSLVPLFVMWGAIVPQLRELWRGDR
jgi:hypothetical protein